MHCETRRNCGCGGRTLALELGSPPTGCRAPSAAPTSGGVFALDPRDLCWPRMLLLAPASSSLSPGALLCPRQADSPISGPWLPGCRQNCSSLTVFLHWAPQCPGCALLCTAHVCCPSPMNPCEVFKGFKVQFILHSPMSSTEPSM